MVLKINRNTKTRNKAIFNYLFISHMLQIHDSYKRCWFFSKCIEACPRSTLLSSANLLKGTKNVSNTSCCRNNRFYYVFRWWNRCFETNPLKTETNGLETDLVIVMSMRLLKLLWLQCPPVVYATLCSNVIFYPLCIPHWLCHFVTIFWITLYIKYT